MTDQNAQQRYTSLALAREPFLFRARGYAALTVPSAQPPVGSTYSQDMPQPWMGLSARCVLNLASKLVSALLPAGSKAFRLGVPAKVLAKAGVSVLNAEQERMLSLCEDIVDAEVERAMWRNKFQVGCLALIVTGNCLVQMLPDNRLRVFRLDQFVVIRDGTGKLTELLICEPVNGKAIPDALEGLMAPTDTGSAGNLFTHCRLDNGVWTVYQETNGAVIPKSQGTYKDGQFPFFAVRWSEIVGEDYGRSKVEDHEPDHRYGELLTKATGDGAAIASRAIIMLSPNAAGGLNLRRRIRDARSGDVVVGDGKDADFKSWQGVQGFQFAAQELTAVKKELQTAYLMSSSAQRDGERVTAFELRTMIDELESTLGGVYSLLASEMMGPLVRRLMVQMMAAGDLPDLKDGLVEPTILTGLAALGREADVQRVSTALGLIKDAPPAAAQYINFTELFERALVGIGLADCVFSQDEVKQQQQQAAALQAMQNAAAPVAGAMAQGAASQPAQGPAPTQAAGP